MYIHYDWVKDYLAEAPSMEEAARLLNLTGLETELEPEGLEIEHTYNRPDGMSHFGVARELAVKLNTEVVEPPGYEGEIPVLEGWKIESEDHELCWRYTGLLVENVKAEPSPQWLKDKLAAIDQTSHNFLVDLTNFLLWEYGHPSHAFDAKLLKDNHIIVRKAREDERLTTLDGNEHAVGGLLCICDAEKPIALAGVMGGENSEVDDTTTELLLELAVFDTASTWRSGHTCKIHSDARQRFERGVDQEKMERVIRRFIYLLLQQQPEARVVGLHDMNHKPFKRAEVLLRRERMDTLLGISIPSDQVEQLLTTMECDFERRGKNWLVRPPGFKVDVLREADVVEEIIRFAGLDLLVTDLPPMSGTDLKPDAVREAERAMRRALQGLGFQEAYTFSFQNEAWDRAFSPEGEPIRVRNPMSANQGVMRRLILPGLLNSMAGNIKRGQDDLHYFEVGHSFPGGGDEPHHLAVVIHSGKEKDFWWDNPTNHPFYQIKGVFETLADRLGWSDVLELRQDVPAYLLKGEALGVYYKGTCIGGFGTLVSEICRLDDFSFEKPPVVMELNLHFVHDLNIGHGNAEEISKFPGTRKDLALVVDESLAFEDIQKHLLGLDLDNLEGLDLFDVYKGKAVGEGKKSLGFRFRFRADERTLTSDEVTGTMDRVISSVKQTFGAEIRT